MRTALKSTLTLLTLCLLLGAGRPALAEGNGHNPVYSIYGSDEVQVRLRSEHVIRPGNSMTAEVALPDKSMAELRVETPQGKVMWSASMPLDAGVNLLRLKVRQLPEGFYLLKVKAGDQTDTQHFIVK